MKHTQYVQVIIFKSTNALWRWELSASTTPFPKFCVPLGNPKTVCSAVLVNLGSFRQFFFFLFVMRITYQCLQQELAINLLPYKSV